MDGIWNTIEVNSALSLGETKRKDTSKLNSKGGAGFKS